MITLGNIAAFLVVMAFVGLFLLVFEKLKIDPTIKYWTRVGVLLTVAACLVLWAMNVFGVGMDTPIVPSRR